MNAGLFRCFAVCAAVSAIAASGCSDDIVCPEPQPAVYISAQLIEQEGATPATSVRVAATADPLPSLLAAYLNGMRISHVEASGLGLVATLESDVVLFHSSNACSLSVTTDFGFATAGLTVPEAAAATAPASAAPAETLLITWTRAAGADYYRIRGAFTGGAAGDGPPEGSSGVAARPESLFSAVTRDTELTYVVSTASPPGLISGMVRSIAGPFPEGGSESNVSGDAWGFFTASYANASSAFSIEVGEVAALARDH
jgi:hypothetical protein